MVFDKRNPNSNPPNPLEYDLQTIPAGLRKSPSCGLWIWKLNKAGTYWTKVSVDKHGTPVDCRAFNSPFSQAVKAQKKIGAHGIGFHFSPDNDILGLDLDDCVKDGVISKKAQKIIDKLNSYWEISVSGTGIHIIGKGSQLINGVDEKIVFHDTRFFTFSGNGQGKIRNIGKKVNKHFRKPTTGSSSNPNPTLSDISISDITKIVSSINPDLPESAWWDVCKAIHHKTNGSDKGWQLFNAWSAGVMGGVYEDYSERECRKKWDRCSLDKDHLVGMPRLKEIAAEYPIEKTRLDLSAFKKGAFGDVDSLTSLMITPGTWERNPVQPPSLIRSMINYGSLALVIGKWKNHKTFIVLLLAFCLSTGKNFHGKECKKTPVIYIAAEGPWDVQNRVNALMDFYGVDEHGIYLFPKSIPLHTEDGRETLELLAELVIKETGQKPYVVVDTVARNSSGQETNEAFSELVVQLQQTIDDTSCGVLMVHHPGHSEDAQTRGRGGSSLVAAVDHEYLVRKGGHSTRLTCNQNRTGPDGWDLYFNMPVVKLPYKHDGMKVTTLIAEPIPKPKEVEKGFSGNIEKVLDFVVDEGGEVEWFVFKEKYESDKDKAKSDFGYSTFKSLLNTVKKALKDSPKWTLDENSIGIIK